MSPLIQTRSKAFWMSRKTAPVDLPLWKPAEVFSFDLKLFASALAFWSSLVAMPDACVSVGVAFLGIWTVKTVLNPISGQVFDEGHGESGVLRSAEWHDDDWLDDGIREAWLLCFVRMVVERERKHGVAFVENLTHAQIASKVLARVSTARNCSRSCARADRNEKLMRS
ncbi:uncharacterized protein TNCV_3265031 [Trichonephila clavipes]|nr:uncharacterized protein TNCV_3265031 [Trichonephila clavipes]